MNYDLLIQAVSILYQQGLRYCVISPGSRSAPLTITFARHEGIRKIIVPDERSAAFIGLGIALQTKTPVALVCTSGSAVYNYAPAIAEAFYQGIPLLVLTGDRPPEWINQQDGQTLSQSAIFGNHVKASYDFPGLDNHKDAQRHALRMINESYLLSSSGQPGPVHLNFPFREPFYPHANLAFDFSSTEDNMISAIQLPKTVLNEPDKEVLQKTFKSFRRVLVIVGQSHVNAALDQALSTFSATQKVPVYGDIISNLDHEERQYHFSESSLLSDDNDNVPELVITIGKSILSKKLKSKLRKVKSLVHWHIKQNDTATDIFQHLTKVITGDAVAIIEALNETPINRSDEFINRWRTNQKTADTTTEKFFQDAHQFNEFSAIKCINQHLPSKSDLHLSNSMTVRYFNILGLNNRSIAVFCNRGVSGIDGSTGTAVGCALTHSKLTTLITGDLAFFYDRNSLWHGQVPENLRIIVMNNHGGGIFGLIPGSSSQPELETYFETPHTLSAENTAKDFGLDYRFTNNELDLKTQLSKFFQPSDRSKILEVATDRAINKDFYDRFLKMFTHNLSSI